MTESGAYPPYPHPVYRGPRQPVYAAGGMVATSQPLAVQAGIAMLQRGGSAVDAALAAAVALTVVEPASCGVGGDAFALVWDGGVLHGLNGSGRSPVSLTAETVRRRGFGVIPNAGWLAVTVPGAVAAWIDLHRRFGRLPLAALFEPAVQYAEAGYPVSPVARYHWQWAVIRLRRLLAADEFARWAETYAPAGHAPPVGSLWRSPALAETLRVIAETGGEALYRGELAEQIDRFSAQSGGFVTADDLAAHRSSWVEPVSTNYRGLDVWEIPPNGQGLAALLALNILEGFDLPALTRDSAGSYHLQIEAMKLAYADARRYIADPDQADVPTAALLSKDYADRRRGLIGQRALRPSPGDPMRSGTAFLCAADADGLMVSLIESTFSGFGSGMVVPGTGICFQNRGCGFTLEAGHPNQLEPGKRPYHTIIPGFLTRAGQPVGPFGVMGGHMQPQGHVQMVVNLVDYGLNPQASLDAPRWFWWDERAVRVEPGTPPAVLEGLATRGHAVEIDSDIDVFGSGQIIRRLESGAYEAGSDGRTDGGAAGI